MSHLSLPLTYFSFEQILLLLFVVQKAGSHQVKRPTISFQKHSSLILQRTVLLKAYLIQKHVSMFNMLTKWCSKVSCRMSL